MKSINILMKKDNNSKMSNRIYLKITGYVDFDMLQNIRRKVLQF